MSVGGAQKQQKKGHVVGVTMYLCYVMSGDRGLGWLSLPRSKLVLETLVEDLEWQSYPFNNPEHISQGQAPSRERECPPTPQHR